MKKLATISVIIITVLLFLSSCSNSNLSEDKAKKTVESLLAKGAELPDNSPNPAQLIEYQGLIQVSETEMHARAIIQHKDGRMNGQFIFHKNSENKWILDKVEFRVQGRVFGNYWNQNVFQKVE